MPSLISSAAIVTVGILLSLAAGCAGPGLQPRTTEKVQEPLKPGEILDARTGRRTSQTALLDELRKARIVYVGETHTSAADHRMQLEILQGLQAQNPRLVLAMEMFPRRVQPVLDQFSQGRISIEDFPREVGWESVWGFPFQLYRNLLEFAQRNRLGILGLNAPHAVVRKVARSGLVSLTPEERSEIAEDFHLDNSRHREYVRKAFEEHGQGDIQGFDTFYEAQLTWEETMAETLAEYLSLAPEEEQIVVFVGQGHMRYKLGIPRLAAERIPHAYRTVVPLSEEDAGASPDRELGDFLWVVEKLEPMRRSRLGIVIRPHSSGTGVEIASVIPRSPAARAGLLDGDVIIGVNDATIQTAEDLHQAMAHKGTIHAVSVKRGGREETIVVDLAP